MQYTIRGIPPILDNALRERARAAGKSLNETAVEALAEGAGMGGTRKSAGTSAIFREHGKPTELSRPRSSHRTA